MRLHINFSQTFSQPHNSYILAPNLHTSTKIITVIVLCYTHFFTDNLSGGTSHVRLRIRPYNDSHSTRAVTLNVGTAQSTVDIQRVQQDSSKRQRYRRLCRENAPHSLRYGEYAHQPRCRQPHRPLRPHKQDTQPVRERLRKQQHSLNRSRSS